MSLINASREMFEELGFRDARISDIAERAGTSYGVFYHYFESKEAVLRELFTAVTGEMFAASRVLPDVPEDPIARIEASNRQYLVAAARNARLIAVIEELAIRDPYFRALKLQIREPFVHRNETGIQRLQERGLADPDIDAAMAAAMLGGMVEHFSLMWFVHGVDYDEDSAVDTLTKLWAKAIGLRTGVTSDAQSPKWHDGLRGENPKWERHAESTHPSIRHTYTRERQPILNPKPPPPKPKPPPPESLPEHPPF